MKRECKDSRGQSQGWGWDYPEGDEERRPPRGPTGGCSCLTGRCRAGGRWLKVTRVWERRRRRREGWSGNLLDCGTEAQLCPAHGSFPSVAGAVGCTFPPCCSLRGCLCLARAHGDSLAPSRGRCPLSPQRCTCPPHSSLRRFPG